MPSRPFSANSTSMPVRLERARQREDVAHVVVDDQDLLAAEERRRRCAAARASGASLGQLRLDAVQEQRRLVEQPLRRARVLDDDRLRVPLAASSPRAGSAPCRCRRSPAVRGSARRVLTVSSSSKPVIFGSFRSSTMQSKRGSASSAASASSRGADRDDLDVAVAADQLDDRSRAGRSSSSTTSSRRTARSMNDSISPKTPASDLDRAGFSTHRGRAGHAARAAPPRRPRRCAPGCGASSGGASAGRAPSSRPSPAGSCRARSRPA